MLFNNKNFETDYTINNTAAIQFKINYDIKDGILIINKINVNYNHRIQETFTPNNETQENNEITFYCDKTTTGGKRNKKTNKKQSNLKKNRHRRRKTHKK